MLRYLLITQIFLIVNGVNAQKLEIGIYANQSLTSILISVNEGAYELWCDSVKQRSLKFDDIISLSISDSGINLQGLANKIGVFKSVFLKEQQVNSSLKIKPRGNSNSTNIYQNDLQVIPSDNSLHLVNQLDLGKYIAGVIEKEVGPSSNLEYYKIQAVICRTYALNNLSKHRNENFDLCDAVHCQAFLGKSQKNRNIQIAVAATDNLVLVDNNNRLILAAYHSNCGGQTEASEKVWKSAKTYLKSTTDTFCINERNAKWEKVISKSDWSNYLKINFDTKEDSSLFCFYQDVRKSHISVANKKIPVVSLRKDWHLRSTFFNLEEQSDDTILLTGRGYGHGVGLCQQGAMRMSEMGYTYRQIINKYYSGVRLIVYSSL